MQRTTGISWPVREPLAFAYDAPVSTVAPHVANAMAVFLVSFWNKLEAAPEHDHIRKGRRSIHIGPKCRGEDQLLFFRNRSERWDAGEPGGLKEGEEA